jgi:hypothetical protein
MDHCPIDWWPLNVGSEHFDSRFYGGQWMRMNGSDSYGFRRGLIAAFVGLALFASSPAAAQSDGSIIGTVVDDTGGVLPGVTVTVSSPDLLVGQMFGVTNETGDYRVAPLPPGDYEVMFELPGFDPATQSGIQLTIGFVATVNGQLGVGTLQETVTVTGEAPVVDVTQTSGSTQLTNEILELSATPRNGLMSLMTLAPGVRTFTEVGGGAMMLENPNPRVYGVGGATYFTLDGMAAQSTNQSVSWDYNSFDEVRVQTLGADAEQPTKGVQITAVVKSGGNTFHGGGMFTGANKSFTGNNLDADLEALGINSGDALDAQFDASGELGGYLVRDKVWFYHASRKRRAAFDVLGAFKPDGSPGQLVNNQRQHTTKISYQANAQHRFIFLNAWEVSSEEKGISEDTAYESREFKVNGRPNTSGKIQSVYGSSMVVDLQFAHLRNLSGGPFLNNPPIVGRSDLETGKVTGDGIIAGEVSWNRNYHVTGSMTYYQQNWAGGSHEFKLGVDYQEALRDHPGQAAKDINYHLQYSFGVPERVAFVSSPNVPVRGAELFGAYLKDSWRIGNRLTLNLGIRLSRESVFAPAQSRETAIFPADVMFPAESFARVQLPIFTNLAPRLHAAYDLTGDGQTVVKGGYGRYFYRRHTDIVQRYNPNSVKYGVFAWNDLNGNNDWDENETNRDPNGPDFIGVTGTEFDDLSPLFVPNPDEKQVYYDEFTLQMEHQLVQNLSVRLTGIYSNTNNVTRALNPNRPESAYNIPITNRDPGPDGTLGTGDDGELFTYFEYSPDLQGFAFEEFTPVLDPTASQSFKTIEMAAVKRLSNNWQMVASFSATKSNWPLGARNSASSQNFGSASPSFSAAGDSAGFFTPNDLINTSNNTWDWDAKLTGTYIFPLDIVLSGNFHSTSGDPFARTVRFSGGVTIPAIVLAVEPIGTQRRPTLNILQFKIEKGFDLPGGQRASVQMNVYNALNANTTVQVQNRSGGAYLRPRSILPPRLFELGIAYDF